VDFLVVTQRQLSEGEQAALQALHGRLHERDVPWAEHLEGSYAPREWIGRLDPAHRPFFYLDNGARELVWDDHCNTAVVRWTLREHGIVLTGPPAAQLIDPVPAERLRAASLATAGSLAGWARESPDRYRAGDRLGFSRWKQPFLVLTLCRCLYTGEAGAVVSKRQAGEWALRRLDRRWAALIQSALDDRADPWQRVGRPAEPGVVDETIAFVDYAVRASAAGSLNVLRAQSPGAAKIA
jgi:Domain of unknown function (DUF4111)